MNKRIQTLGLLAALAFCVHFVSCSSSTAENPTSNNSLVEKTPEVKKVVEKVAQTQPKENYALKHINEVLYPNGAFDELSADEQRYDYEMVDLNDDGKEETLFTLINMDYCGSGGCTLFLLNSDGEFMGKVTGMDVPVSVSKEKRSGWRDLYVSTRGNEVVLQYGEGEYTTNASMAKETTKEDRKANTAQTILTKFALN